MNNIFMKYKHVFLDNLFAIFSSKKRVDHKIEVILGDPSTCKASYLLAPNKLNECKFKWRRCWAKDSFNRLFLRMMLRCYLWKKNWSMRLRLNYRGLNQKTVKLKYSISCMNEFLTNFKERNTSSNSICEAATTKFEL